jgi:ergothioneine biosynthesis protein EgtB
MSKTSQPSQSLVESARPESPGERFRRVRNTTTALTEPLEREDYVVQSMTEASPAKWHLAHTSWFFETFLLGETADYKPFHPQFKVLFNSYYQQVGAMHSRPHRGLLSRPTVDEVLNYRRHVDAAVDALLQAGDLEPSQLAVLETGLHHEQQHQELIVTDLKHMFSHNPLRPAYLAESPVHAEQEASVLSWVDHPGGLLWVGREGEGFTFDNETPRHRQFLQPFAVASRLVTCGEYLQFMADGGYERPELWLSEGWEAVRREGWSAPLYWERRADGWSHFTLSGMRRVDAAEPVVHVSYFEADAYANWTSYRLATEAEWEVLAKDLPIQGNFLDDRNFHPTASAGGDGVAQVFGDAWEWTRSPYAPYPGYRAAPGALGEYNGKFMVNQMVLRGGSCATPSDHIRASYRNFFHPGARWQYSGIRLVRDR